MSEFEQKEKEAGTKFTSTVNIVPPNRRPTDPTIHERVALASRPVRVEPSRVNGPVARIPDNQRVPEISNNTKLR